MNHPDKLLPTATNRAIAIEHLTHHLRRAASEASGAYPFPAEHWRSLAERLVDGPAYSVQHTPRRDRLVITFNPPRVGHTLPVAVDGDMTEHVAPGIFDDGPLEDAAAAAEVEPPARKWGEPVPSEGDGSPDDVAATGDFDPGL